MRRIERPPLDHHHGVEAEIVRRHRLQVAGRQGQAAESEQEPKQEQRVSATLRYGGVVEVFHAFLVAAL